MKNRIATLRPLLLVIVCASSILALARVPALGATITWIGPTTGVHLWSSPSNWPEGRLPTAQDDVRIEGEGINLVVQVLGTANAGSLDSTSTIQIIGDLPAHGLLNVAQSFRNRGLVQIMSRRSDRSATLSVGGLGTENLGTIRVESENAGGRRMVGGLLNRGQVEVEPGIGLGLENMDRNFVQASGGLNVEGSLAVTGGTVAFTGGTCVGNVAFYNGQISVAATFVNPATVKVLGSLSRFAGNSSPAFTIQLDTDFANHTVLTSLPNAVNDGKIVLGSARSDRNSRLEIPDGLINSPSGTIQSSVEAGGSRAINGRLVNQGLVVSSDVTTTFTGTYQADGGVVQGGVHLLNSRIIPTKQTAQSTELMLFGANSLLEGDNPSNMNLRVISDVAFNAVLRFTGSLVNRGTISLESPRSDRTSTFNLGAFTLENSGMIKVLAGGGGGRRIEGRVNNYGKLEVEPNIQLTIENLNSTFNQFGGNLTVNGSLNLLNGKFNLVGGAVAGDVKLFNTELFTDAALTSPATLFLLGQASILRGNNSPIATLRLQTDFANNTTLTTGPGAINHGKIVLGSSRADRNSKLEFGSGFVNSPSGSIDSILEAGGGRAINGRLMNQGRVSSTGVTTAATGIYEAHGGTVEGDVQFWNAEIVPVTSPAQNTELRLYGAGSVLAASNIKNLTLRVISDFAAHATLTFRSNVVNNGAIHLESLRSDRNSLLAGQDGTVVNGSQGLIVSTPENGGQRTIRAKLFNRGLIRLLWPLTVSSVGAAHANFGILDLNGTALTASGQSFLNAEGGRILGSGSLNVTGAPFTNAGIISPGASPGALAIQGNWTQSSSGWVDIEIAGPESAGIGFDAIQVTGSVTLNGGRLLTRLLGDYLPEGETRFRVLSTTQTITGRFSEYPNLQIHPDRFLRPEYLPTALDLRVFAGVDQTLPPSISLHPISKTVGLGEPVEFLVSVNGVGPFTYQWRLNGEPIEGADSNRYALSSTESKHFGNYDVIVRNAAGESTSTTALLLLKEAAGTQLDFGDAPDIPYPTLAIHNGAAQRVTAGFSLGPSIDADPGTLQNASATADGADEDGVVFLDPLIPGQPATIRVLFTRPVGFGSGLLSAWIDWLDNGSWDAADLVINNQVLNARTNDFVINVPAQAVVGSTFSRFRLYSDNNPGVNGISQESGEVEDYSVEIRSKGEPTTTDDFGDAPDSYKTLLASNGARHTRIPELYLGQRVDLEADGAPTPLALGDDLNPAGQSDDEDGVSTTTTLTPGGSAIFNVTVVGSGILYAWLDFNRDGDFGEADERIINAAAVTTGTSTYVIQVPAGALPGSSFARFRLSKQGTPLPEGSAPDGEVEDHAVTIQTQNKDWSDAPEQGTSFPTTLARNGARHSIAQGFYLGARIDAEVDGQPNLNASGDDLATANIPDDEDGVTFSTPLVPGEEAEINVVASQTGQLDLWIDLGRDGSWAQANDRIFTSKTLVAGNNTLIFMVPDTSPAGPTFARFRLSRNGVNTFDGDGGEGEVEDYRVSIETPSDCALGCEGTDFWFTFPGNFAPDPAYPLTPRVRVTGTSGTTVTVSIPGLATTINTNISGTGVTITLPVEVDLGSLNDSTLNRGIHLTASAPVGVQAISQVKYSSDGFLALPSEVLTGNYTVAAYPNVHVGVPEISGSQFAIVATQPNTIVTITPSFETGLRVADFPYSITLTNQGDCYQLRNTNDAPADLTGTLIEASQPVAVFGGHVAANVNSSSLFFADFVVEQLVPNERLGLEYFTAPLTTRTGGETIRIVASQDDTEVTLDGAVIILANRGDVHEALLASPSHITADKPVHVSQFASSSDFDGVVNADPFMVTVPARSWFSDSHTFATGGTNFMAHYVTVVAPSSVTELTINGAIETPAFSNIGSSGYRYAHRLMAQGIHTISASEAIGIIVYGWNEYESYGWPACLSFGDTTPPRVTCPAEIVTINLGDQGQTDTPCKVRLPDFRQQVTYTDNCGFPVGVGVTQTPAPGTLLGVGEHEVTLSVTDTSGNVGRCTVTVIVRDPAPGNLISLNCPTDITVPCTDTNGAIVRFKVEALRGCTPISVVCTPESGSRFPIGTTKVVCRINEPGVPVQECTFNVTVDCQKQRAIQIKPTATQPGGQRELLLEWDEEAGITLEVADEVSGPWVRIDGVTNRYVIRIAQERGKFYRLKGN